MKISVPFFLLAFFVFHAGTAQIETVEYNVVNNMINNNNPLPSEEIFYIRGILPPTVELVKVKVNRHGKSSNYSEEYLWKKAFDFQVSQYEVFVSRELRANDNYDLEFSYYSRAEGNQVNEVKESLNKSLEAYIRANFEVSASGIKSNNSDQVMMSQLNQIVRDGLEDYRHFLGRDFRGFSDVVRQKLEQKNRLKLRRARFNILGRNKDDNEKAVYANQYIEELVDVVHNEADQFLSNSLMSLVDIRTISNYPTEKKSGTLPLNFGYGAIAVKRSLPNTEYLQGPYVGLSLPLGNRVFTKFLGNASFSTGVFLNNFEVGGSNISGPLVNLPIYAGLGYKMFRVFRLNAGAVLINLEEPNSGPSVNYIQPFVGISFEFNLWVGLNNRR